MSLGFTLWVVLSIEASVEPAEAGADTPVEVSGSEEPPTADASVVEADEPSRAPLPAGPTEPDGRVPPTTDTTSDTSPLGPEQFVVFSAEPSPPEPMPPERWEREHRKLIGLTTAAGVSVGAGVLMSVVPWVGPCDDFRHGCIFRNMALTTIGVPLAVSATVGVLGWSIMLAQHRARRPSGTARGRRLRLVPMAGGFAFGMARR